MWSGYLQHAWHVLSSDRYYGSMGGMGRIYYSSASQYARDNEIPLEPFITFLYAMDEEYVAHVARAQKAAAESVQE